jgi:hypothetical protein
MVSTWHKIEALTGWGRQGIAGRRRGERRWGGHGRTRASAVFFPLTECRLILDNLQVMPKYCTHGESGTRTSSPHRVLLGCKGKFVLCSCISGCWKWKMFFMISLQREAALLLVSKTWVNGREHRVSSRCVRFLFLVSSGKCICLLWL